MPFFFFNDTATTEIYTLSLHDALPICLAAEAPAHVGAVHHPRSRPRGRDRRLRGGDARWRDQGAGKGGADIRGASPPRDRKSTRLNSSHDQISYAVFCLKKKNSLSSAISRRRSHCSGRYQLTPMSNVLVSRCFFMVHHIFHCCGLLSIVHPPTIIVCRMI